MRLQHTQFQTVISAINCFYNINNFVVAALVGTQTFHWFAFRDCPSLSYPTPFDISRLQRTQRRTATAYGSGVLLLVVATLFGTQTLHWFAFREQLSESMGIPARSIATSIQLLCSPSFFAGEDAPHPDRLIATSYSDSLLLILFCGRDAHTPSALSSIRYADGMLQKKL